jgi:hypothetical protein
MSSAERRNKGTVVVATGGVVVALTNTVVVAVVIPVLFIAESVYVVVTRGATTTDELATAPIPLSTDVELAFVVAHVSVALCPAVIVAGVAVKILIVASGARTVAEQVVVAIVDDASVAVKPIVTVPGRYALVCTVEVLPLLHRNATGAIPPVDVAVHVTFEAETIPVHEVARVALAVATPNDNIMAPPKREAPIPFNFINYFCLNY